MHTILAMTKHSKAFGSEVRKYREAKRLSQEKLGELIGLTGPGVGQMERGERKIPKHEVLLGLQEVLGLPVERSYELLGLIPSKSPNDPLTLLYRLDAAASREERLEIFGTLPPEIQTGILALMQDILSDGLQALEELRKRLTLQASRDDNHDVPHAALNH